MGISRRAFLKASVTAAAGIAVPSVIKAATPWAALPGNMPKYKTLEIFLPGGASQWENFWVSLDGPPSAYGNIVDDGHLNWRGFEQRVHDLTWQNCENAPLTSLNTQLFGTDANNTSVYWGPATSPLWQPEIFNRCRMLVTSHDDDLHFSAGYRTLTGRRFGSPRGAGLGTAIQRHYQSLGQSQNIPYSYLLAPDHLEKKYFFTYPTLLGRHPGPARPLALKVGAGADALLQREGISTKADLIFNELRDQYRVLLRWQGNGAPVGSMGFENYDSASDYLVTSDQLDVHLGGEMLKANNDLVCVYDGNTGSGFGSTVNRTRRSLEVAAYMLNNGTKHITVIDGGFNNDLLRDSNTPYDAHGNNGVNLVEMTSAHLFRLLRSLAGVIDNGTSSPSAMPKIDLSETLIVLHTEFNREPKPNGANGREHFPFANVALLIGGPVSSREIYGGIGLEAVDKYETALPVDALSPTDIHAAALMAAGIDPLGSDNFTSGDDFSDQIKPGGSTNKDQIRLNLKQKVLGIGNQPFATKI